MGKYLDIAKRTMQESAARPESVDIPPEPSISRSPQPVMPAEVAGWPEERQEIWEERAAILEVDAGLSRTEAEREALALCRPQPDGPHELLEVGKACPVCRRHLYVRRQGRVWCDRCMRKGGP
jgi:hypothetical protein